MRSDFGKCPRSNLGLRIKITIFQSISFWSSGISNDTSWKGEEKCKKRGRLIAIQTPWALNEMSADQESFRMAAASDMLVIHKPAGLFLEGPFQRSYYTVSRDSSSGAAVLIVSSCRSQHGDHKCNHLETPATLFSACNSLFLLLV